MSPLLILGAALILTLIVGLLPIQRAAFTAKTILLLAIFASFACLAPIAAPAGALLRQDSLAVLWQVLFLLAAIPLVVLMNASSELPVALIASSLVGMMLMGTANHLVLFFLGLELMSLPSYLLVHQLRRDRRSLEAALKYFFAGSVGSALFLFGISMFYSMTGTFAMEVIAASSPRLELALVLMGAGALFKIGAAPLHFWLPDVYEASAPELAGFFSTGVKAAGLLFLLRVLEMLPPYFGGFASWLAPVSIVTMTVGNILALRQTSLQRLLAYSSIAHVGYLLLGVWAWNAMRPLSGPATGPAAVFVYAASYLFMSSGAFIALHLTGMRERRQLSGFARKNPLMAAFFALMLLSLASVPPTAGFLAKFLVFWEAIKAGGAWLAAIAAANSIIGLGYYFALIRDLYLGQGTEAVEAPRPLALGQGLLVAACAVPTLILGLWPQAVELAASWMVKLQ